MNSDANCNTYKYYGAKGIRCMWNSFEEFMADMGPTYQEGLTIGRISNSGNYCKENCRWETYHQQTRNYSRNRVLEYDGRKQVLIDWAKEFGIKRQTLTHRLNVGWDLSRALTEPVRSPCAI